MGNARAVLLRLVAPSSRRTRYASQGMVLVIVVAVAGGSFLLVRESRSRSPVEAEGPSVNLPADVQIGLLHDRATAPRETRVINGITVGRDVERTGSICGPDAPAEYAAPGASFGTPLDPRPGYLPLGTIPDGSPHLEEVVCGGTLAAAEALYRIPHDLGRGNRGGFFSVLRFVGDSRVEIDEPSDRLLPFNIGDRRGVLSPPLTPDGFGSSVVVIVDGPVVTKISAFGLNQGELRRIASSIGTGSNSD